VHVHDEPVERAPAGRRVALNLAGLPAGAVGRGDVVADPTAALAPSFRLDCALTWATPESRPEHGTRVHVHHGTREVPARIAELGGRYFQLRLEAPVVPAAGDRIVVRSVAPPDTLGGGIVLDPAPPRHGPSNDVLSRLERLRRGEPEPPPPAPRAPAPAAGVQAPPALTASALAVEQELRDAGLTPPLDADLEAEPELAALRAAGRAARLGPAMHAHAEALAAAEAAVVALAERDGEVTIASLRDELAVSRKYAQAFLEHCDAARITLRTGDRRVLRRRRA
jgi:selenocysteine-specific elongation factor